MHERALVVGVIGDTVKVVPLISDVCIDCHSLCLYRGNPMTVSNRKHYDIKTGSIVKIGSARLIRAFFRLYALVFPLAAAIAAFFLFPFVEALIPSFFKLKILPPDALKAGFVFASFLAGCGIVFIISRSNIHISKLEVREVVTH